MGQNLMRSTYRRSASGAYLCKEWEVEIMMLAEQRPKLAMDAEILEGYTLDVSTRNHFVASDSCS